MAVALIMVNMEKMRFKRWSSGSSKLNKIELKLNKRLGSICSEINHLLIVFFTLLITTSTFALQVSSDTTTSFTQNKPENAQENLTLNAQVINSKQVINQQDSISKISPPSSEDSMKFPLYMRIIATFVCLLIFTVGVSGNLLVPIVVIKTKYLRNSTNLFLINLAVADLLVLIICEPTVLIELHSRPETWLLGEPMCKISNFVEMSAANASIFTILAISFERYYAICKPLKAGYKCTRLRATIIICFIWLLSFILTSPILIMAKSSETIYIDGSLVYNCILETDTYWHKMYVFVSMFAFFCLPLIVLMIVYWLISRRLTRENLAMSTTTSLATANESQNETSQNQHQLPCCQNNLRGKRSQSLRKTSSFKYSVSTFLTSRHNNSTNNNNKHDHTAAQSDHIIVVDVSKKGRSNVSLKRPLKLTSEKALSLDHHLTAKVGCDQLLTRANNHYDSNIGHRAYNSQFVRASHGKHSIINKTCCDNNKTDLENDEQADYEKNISRAPGQKQFQQQQQQKHQQINLINVIKNLSSTNSESFLRFIHQLFCFKAPNDRRLQTGNNLSRKNSLNLQNLFHHQEVNTSSNDCSKSEFNLKDVESVSFGEKIEANEYSMESISEEHHASNFNDEGVREVNIIDRNLSSYINDNSNQNQEQKTPLLNSVNINCSTSVISAINQNSSVNSTSINSQITHKLDDIDSKQEQSNKGMRIFGNAARSFINGAKGTFKFKWPRQASIASSISIPTQTNSTNLPSESSVGPLSRCDSFNNPQVRPILTNNDYNSSSANSTSSQIIYNSFNPDQISNKSERDQDDHHQEQNILKRKHQKLYTKKYAHFGSSLSSNKLTQDINPALVANVSMMRNNQDHTNCNFSSPFTTSNSSSPSSAYSSSPDSSLEQKKQQHSIRVGYHHHHHPITANNSLASSYKHDLHEVDCSIEVEEKESSPYSSTNEQQQQHQIVQFSNRKVINKSLFDENLDRISENHLLMTGAEAELGKVSESRVVTESLTNNCTIYAAKPIASLHTNTSNCDNSIKHIGEQNNKQTDYHIDTHAISSQMNKNVDSSLITEEKIKGSEQISSGLMKSQNKSLDVGESNRHRHHFQFNFSKRPYWGKRKSNPVICNHQFRNKTQLNELLVVQDLSKKQQMDSRRQVVIMLAFVVAAFFLLFFPYRVFTIWLILSTEDQVQSLGMETYYNLTYFSRILIYLHSAINPIAYNLISTKFRRAFMSILLCHGSSTRRNFTTEHRIVNVQNKRNNNSNSDQKKSIPNRAL